MWGVCVAVCMGLAGGAGCAFVCVGGVAAVCGGVCSCVCGEGRGVHLYVWGGGAVVCVCVWGWGCSCVRTHGLVHYLSFIPQV